MGERPPPVPDPTFLARSIEDHALIGDTHTAGLVARDGTLDWLCVPRFDGAACFAALLGNDDHGQWRLAPVGPVRAVRRTYRDHTMVLSTEFDTDEGTVRVVDCMPMPPRGPSVVRIVQGVSGAVPMALNLVIRFDYGQTVPWVHSIDGGLTAIGGPDALDLFSPVDLRGEDLTTTAEFTVTAGDEIPFRLVWRPSYAPLSKPANAARLVRATERWWRNWAKTCSYEGPHADLVVRSLVTLKALTYSPTGGMVAAPTTSLPERLGGDRNWDYRYCWVRDATFTLYAFLLAGYVDEASAWRAWLSRAVAGEAGDLQIMYGVAGERRLTELELPWLPGHEGSVPVREGNGACEQFQLDVYGEVLDAMHLARRHEAMRDERSWGIELAMLEHLEGCWRDPDEGIWEVRGPRRQFVHSKVMAWVAFDRAVKAVEQFGREGPVARWRAVRAEVHEEVCAKGFDPERGTFTQFYGSRELDASVLMIPLVGFLPVDDPRVQGTMAAVQRELMVHGFVRRYLPDEHGTVDGLPGGGEGVFLACTCWLADNLALSGRLDEAEELFARVAAVANDVGLLPEEYDPQHRQFLGNFPQALSHLSLVNTAFNLVTGAGPARHRSGS
jgi:GH15 family glucan-1,4-alpha-glucosidase